MTWEVHYETKRSVMFSCQEKWENINVILTTISVHREIQQVFSCTN